jgi:hypothetical protein
MYCCHAEAFLYRICTERCNNGGIFMLFVCLVNHKTLIKSQTGVLSELMIFELDKSGLLKPSLVVVISYILPYLHTNLKNSKYINSIHPSPWFKTTLICFEICLYDFKNRILRYHFSRPIKMREMIMLTLYFFIFVRL